MMPVQLVQDLDNVSIGIRPTEGVSSAIEAENNLVGLSGLVSNGGNHSFGGGNERVGRLDGIIILPCYASFIPDAVYFGVFPCALSQPREH